MLSKFWSDFLTGLPTAGLFAVMGALIAYAAARRMAGISRSNALRQEWWDRAEWAFGMATSDDETERFLGLNALEHLAYDATETEYELIAAVFEAYSEVESVSSDHVDQVETAGNNENEGGDQL